MREERAEEREEPRAVERREAETRVERQRESTRTRECDVAECASYIEALEGARKSKKAE